MATGKISAIRTAIPPSAAGVPSERLQKLLQKTNRPDPYPVTDRLSIEPPNKKRLDDLRDSQMEIAIAQQVLDQLMRHVLPVRPEFPIPPEPPAGKATKAQYAGYERAVEQFQVLVAGWEKLNQEWQAAVTRHQEAMDETSKRITENSHRYTRALFGAVYDEVLEFFGEQDPDLWDAFQIDLQQHFRIIATPPEVPDDGKCPHCGRIEDEEQAVKAGKSSA
jgi:hypothetical protein